MSEEKRKIFLVFANEEIGKGRKRLGRWLEVTEEELDSGELEGPESPRERIFGRRLKGRSPMSRAWPGAVYQVDATEEGSTIYPGSAVYKGRWPDEEKVLEWTIHHKAITQVADAEAAMKKDGDRDELLARLEPIAREYRRLPGRHADALLAAVVSRIVRGA